MPRGVHSCKVCDNPETAKLVDEMLNANHKMRDISAALGNAISKSVIHRHAQNCWLRARAEKIRSKHDFRNRRVFVHTEANGGNPESFATLGGSPADPSQMTSQDILLEVVYEKTEVFKNPGAFTGNYTCRPNIRPAVPQTAPDSQA